MTTEQKKARKHARQWGKNVAYAYHHATDGRDEWQGWTTDHWGRMAELWAKNAVRCAFQAHPELRES